MPKQYEAMRGKLVKEGLSRKEAERQAARMYNAQRKAGAKPVGPKRKKR